MGALERSGRSVFALLYRVKLGELHFYLSPFIGGPIFVMLEYCVDISGSSLGTYL